MPAKTETANSPFLDLRRGDCMELMAEYPDNHFDLAIVDPPYGIGASKGVGLYSRRKFEKHGKEWDRGTPKQEYWNELFRVSKTQIVCGANYFLEFLYSSKSFICWVKNNPAPNFAEAEFIWTSTNINGKIYDSGKQIVHEIQREGGSIHPTQKPRKLYDWLLANYAEPGMRILDTHMGSGSIAIACHYFKAHLTACEIDEDYFSAAVTRIKRETAQAELCLSEN